MGQQRATPLRPTQAHGDRWDPPKGAEGAGGSTHRATFHN